MMKPILFVSMLALVTLAGCEAYDLRGNTASYLEPLDANGRYRWKTMADAMYPIDSDKAEAARLRQLDQALKLNPECQAGHVVERRQATRRVDGLMGDIYDVFYTVKCLA